MVSTADVTAYDVSTLAALWVGSVAAIGSVAVAIVFGILTLVNTRQARDAQARATLAAAGAAAGGGVGARYTLAAGGEGATLSIRQGSGKGWLLVNEGPGDVFDVDLAGLTELDRRRLQTTGFPLPQLGHGGIAPFGLVSRLTMPGPANVVVTYRLSLGGPAERRVLLVPSR